jgi:O-antigen/teichoic acid export membrane protein
MTAGTRGRGLRHPFVRDTLTLQAGQVALAALQAARALLILRWLGAAGFAPLALAQALVAVVTLADATTLGRAALVTLARALRDPPDAGAVGAAGPLGGCLALHLGLNAVLVGAFWVVAPWIGASVYASAEVGVLARWLSLPLLIEAPFLLLSLVLQATGRIRVLVLVEAGRALALLATTIAALAMTPSARAVAVAQLATAAAAAIGAVIGYRRLARRDPRLPDWSAIAAAVRRGHGRALLRSSSLIAADKHAGTIAAQAPVLLLGLVDTAAVAPLAAAVRVMALPAPLLTGLARNLDVVLAIRAVDGAAAVGRLWRRATGRTAAAWAPIASAMAVAGSVAIGPVLGIDYAGARALLPWLLGQSLLLGAAIGLGPAMRALDLTGRSLAANLLALALTIGPGWWLVQRHGAAGAAAFHLVRTAVAVAAGSLVVWRATRESV